MSLLNFLVMLPQLIEALLKLQKVVKDYDIESWVTELNEAVKKAEEAHDQKSRLEAAIAIANTISRL